jgi:multidrug efflux pump subunit AcrB
MPPGTVPPFMIAYSAADVPILQLGLSSKTLSELQLQDIAANFLRVQLATVQGAELPGPYGGKNRLVTVDLDPQKLLQRSISGAQVVTAVNAQNLVVPQGTAKIGSREYDVALNSSAKTVAELNDVPIDVVNGVMVYLRDVAYVHDGARFQTNIARTPGPPGVFQFVVKPRKGSPPHVGARLRIALRSRRPCRCADITRSASIDLRAGGREWRVREERHRRRSDGGIDSAFLAVGAHAGGVDFHSAVDSHVVGR